MRNLLVVSVTAGLILAGACRKAPAAWWDDEAGDGLWSSPMNWSDDVLPGTGAKVVVAGGYTATITDNVPPTPNANLYLGVAYQGVDGFPTTPSAGNGTVIQTGGTASFYKSTLGIGSGSGVGLYVLEGGTIYASGTGGFNAIVHIGWNNGGAAAPSGFIQNGGSATFKSLSLACNGNNAKAFYTMNDGTLRTSQYGFDLANGGTGREGVFTQNGGLVSTGDWQENTIKMGSSAGPTGAAIWNLNGGTLEVGTVRSANDANIGFKFQSTTNTYVDIAGGTLVLADDLGVGSGNPTWDYERFIAVFDMANFRSFGQAITSANQLIFTPTTLSGPGYDKTYNATAINGAIPEPGTLALLGMALLGLGWYTWRKRR